MPAVNIRPFEDRDAAGVANLIVGIQRGEYEIAITADDQPDLSSIPEFYQTGAGNFWVAVVDDEVVGTLGLRDIGDGDVALRKMFVAPTFRGEPHRVAQRLLSAALAWAAEKNSRNIFLGTTSRFLAAHRFYEKNGFELVARETLPETFPVMVVDTRFYRRPLM
jgi:RimJ/RimL family protein N-acetyltransferase